MKSVELFAGAGGLAIGVSRAGFKHAAVVEWDTHCCKTIRKCASEWPLWEGDVKDFDFSTAGAGIDLLSGGPPCQPFSLGGKHMGQNDTRNMFPEMIRAIREMSPAAVVVENVKGLLRSTFRDYFNYILLQVANPNMLPDDGESWQDHNERLRLAGDSEYVVSFRLLNAADFGVPQRRERVFIVAVRSDAGILPQFPEPTHSLDALLWSQWVSGEYWRRHDLSRPDSPPKKHAARVRRLAAAPALKPWRTVRDAISDLPEPDETGCGVANHQLVPGARAYPGHTGSPMDEPAKTLKAGAHGVPGGENMLAKPDGSVRYFTVREAARLQTFPDDFEFCGSWTETMRQLGNAVPALLAESVASTVRRTIE